MRVKETGTHLATAVPSMILAWEDMERVLRQLAMAGGGQAALVQLSERRLRLKHLSGTRLRTPRAICLPACKGNPMPLMASQVRTSSCVSTTLFLKLLCRPSRRAERVLRLCSLAFAGCSHSESLNESKSLCLLRVHESAELATRTGFT